MNGDYKSYKKDSRQKISTSFLYTLRKSRGPERHISGNNGGQSRSLAATVLSTSNMARFRQVQIPGEARIMAAIQNMYPNHVPWIQAGGSPADGVQLFKKQSFSCAMIRSGS